ncbi:unnamed protein product [marine sediment metagenome]|uniref:Uncharacterized protein n=1 Tax=marine sediment metagenome TaxID=412755 RepID=X1P2X1_9ZZZZ
MKQITIEKLKPGDQIFAFDWSLQKWIKCKVNQIEKYVITLENIEGNLKGFVFYEMPETLTNPDYYKQAG